MIEFVNLLRKLQQAVGGQAILAVFLTDEYLTTLNFRFRWIDVSGDVEQYNYAMSCYELERDDMEAIYRRVLASYWSTREKDKKP